MKTVEYIEVRGRATLYSTYEDDINDYMQELIGTLNEEQLDEISYEMLEDITEGEMDLEGTLDDELGGCSWENHYLYVTVHYEDGTEENFDQVRIDQIESDGEVEDLGEGLLKVAYAKGACQRYYPTEEISVDRFIIYRLRIVNKVYSINWEEIETHSHLQYDGIDLDYESIEDFDEKWSEWHVQRGRLQITF